VDEPPPHAVVAIITAAAAIHRIRLPTMCRSWGWLFDARALDARRGGLSIPRRQTSQRV
jgi:hypothetical protein